MSEQNAGNAPHQHDISDDSSENGTVTNKYKQDANKKKANPDFNSGLHEKESKDGSESNSDDDRYKTSTNKKSKIAETPKVRDKQNY